MRPVRYVATAADVAATFTPAIPVDYMHSDAQYGIQYQAAGGGAGVGGTVQQTQDDVFNPPAEGIFWTPVALAGGVAQVTGTVRAFRLSNPVLGDILKVLQQGGSPAG